MITTAGELFGRYHLLRELGRGGEAIVYLAEDLLLERRVAIKIFPLAMPAGPSAGPDRFHREVEAQSRLDHPGICRIHDAGVQDGIPYIAMSYVEGRTLGPRAGMDRSEMIGVLEDVAQIIDAAHAAGVVHGDLKPGNILVVPGGRCVVLDFGVARFRDETLQPDADRPAGTLPYLAPEGLTGVVDARSDVYALGAILFELATGRTPFVAPTRAALVSQMLDEEPPLARSVAPATPPDLEAVLARALDRDPGRRYPTVRDFADDLGRLRRGEPVRARRHGPGSRALRWARRRPAAAVLLAFVVAFLAVAATITVNKNRALGRYLERAGDEARRAVDESRAAGEHFLRYARLADHRRLQDLMDRARDLVPPAPALVPALESWLADAKALARGLDGHRRALEEVRSRGRVAPVRRYGAGITPSMRRSIEALQARHARLAAAGSVGPQEGPRGDLARVSASEGRLRDLLEDIQVTLPQSDHWIYGTESDAWQDQTLSLLIADLERFTDSDPSRGTMAQVSARIAEARRLAEADAASAEAWSEVCRSIADRAKSPRYEGLEIKPQSGLIPLRQNPETGLWEFLHVLSGDAPAVSADGRFEMTAESGIVLVLLPGGRTTMGARRPVEGEPGDGPHVDARAMPIESPVHEVVLDPFFISKFEMTLGQWLRAWGSHTGHLTPETELSRPEPTAVAISWIDWHEADQALRRLGLCLPTEAQWECGARAGTTTPWWTGPDPSALAGAAVFGVGEAEPVGRQRPNPFGLHDVAGNVFEWCRDIYASYDNPRMAGAGERAGLYEQEHRMRRGGSFNGSAVDFRSARRSMDSPFVRWHDTGVRPARALDR